MSNFMCVYCGRVFKEETISKPMNGYLGWVWMDDSCPVCRKGCDDWYRKCRISDPFLILKAVRVQRNINE